MGAEVTGVCGAPRVKFVKALGVDRVIDHDKEDFTQSCHDVSPPRLFKVRRLVLW
jgi:NADPH-dependent curcumin reductase CurA